MVVAGFEPLDILAGLVKLLELIRDGRAEVSNLYPRCVSKEGNRAAQEALAVRGSSRRDAEDRRASDRR